MAGAVHIPLAQGGTMAPQTPVKILVMNWLRVFRSADASRMGQDVGQQLQTRAVQSEKGVVLRSRAWDGYAPDRHVFWPACS